MPVKLWVIALSLLSLLASCGKTDLGDTNTQIRWQKKIKENELRAWWPADSAAKIANFSPKFENADLYDLDGIKIVIAETTFETRDIAFGFHALLTAEPRNIFDSGIWYKPPYLAGRQGKKVLIAFSPNQPSFFSPYIHGEMSRRLGKIVDDHDNLSWHKEVLPRSNIYRDSEFYIPQTKAIGVQLFNIYGAKYQSKNSIAYLAIARYKDEQLAEAARESVLMAARHQKIKLTEYPGRLGSSDRGTWWRNERNGVNAILAYKWLVLYFENYADEWHLEQAIQECFAQMHRLRSRTLKEP